MRLRAFGAALVVTLLLGTLGCGPLRINGELGESKTDASTLVLDQERIRAFGFEGAVRNLVELRVKPERARQRITEAYLVLGSGRPVSTVPTPSPESIPPYDGR